MADYLTELKNTLADLNLYKAALSGSYPDRKADEDKRY